MAFVFFPGAFVEIGGYAGGEADKKAVKENDDTCGSQNTQRKAVSPVPEAASTTAAIAGLSMPNFDSSFT